MLGLLSSPTPSAMAAGSFALVAALACAAAFSLGALLDTVRLPRAAVLALAAAGALSAAVTATSPGVLLQSLASVLLWRTRSCRCCRAVVGIVRHRDGVPGSLVRGDAAPAPRAARVARAD